MSSSNVKKIEKALNEFGLILKEATYEPWGIAMEMCGPSGGWYVVAIDPVGDYLDSYEQYFQGLSIDEVLGEIYRRAYYEAVNFWSECEYPDIPRFINDYGWNI